jgi:hypothetical protein
MSPNRDVFRRALPILVIVGYNGPMLLDNIDLTAIQDENFRQLVLRLLNLIESLSADLRDAQAENQRLRDENNRLKGEQGRPKVKANTPPRAAVDHSSELERRRPRPRVPRRKQATLRIDREQELVVERAQLPADAEFKGHEDVIVQDLILRSENTCFHKQKYYAASTGQTYLAALPRGYAGQFGPGLKALAITLYFGGLMSEPKIHEFFTHAGVQISSGQVSNLLIKNQGAFHQEQAAVYEAGLYSTPWQQTDDTATRVNGQNQHCHVVCNPVYTHYQTQPTKDRLTVLDVLRQGRARRFRLNQEALNYLTSVRLSRATRRTLANWSSETDLDEATFQKELHTRLPKLGLPQRQVIAAAAAVAAYHAETTGPVIQGLVCDDAPQFNWLTRAMMLCWVHEGRPYKKLTPVVLLHRQQLADFRKRFWDYYRELVVYRQQPTPAERTRLEADFDTLFATRTGYAALDDRIAKTQAKKTALLLVLQHPELPLHNNAAELAVRRRVRKRDVSFGPRTTDGCKAWDTFMSLAATTQKLGVSFYAYVQDRITGAHCLPPLAELVEKTAQELDLGRSWSVT